MIKREIWRAHGEGARVHRKQEETPQRLDGRQPSSCSQSASASLVKIANMAKRRWRESTTSLPGLCLLRRTLEQRSAQYRSSGNNTIVSAAPMTVILRGALQQRKECRDITVNLPRFQSRFQERDDQRRPFEMLGRLRSRRQESFIQGNEARQETRSQHGRAQSIESAQGGAVAIRKIVPWLRDVENLDHLVGGQSASGSKLSRSPLGQILSRAKVGITASASIRFCSSVPALRLRTARWRSVGESVASFATG